MSHGTLTVAPSQPNPSHHFYICNPKHDDYFEDQLALSIKKLSNKQLCIDDHQPATADGVTVITVRLGLSREGQRLHLSLELALENLCKAMVTKENKCHIDTLTSRSVGGIVPLCPIFKTYWTVSFFNEAIAHGPDMASFLAELQDEAKNTYMIPTVAILGFAVLAGVGSCFSFLSQSGPMSNPTAVDAFCTAAFIGVSDYFRDFVVSTPGPTTTQNEQPPGALVLFQRSRMPYELCDRLCNLTQAAAYVFTLKKDLFDTLISARLNALKSCTAHAVVSGAALWSMTSSIAMAVDMAEGTMLLGGVASSSMACTAAAICWPATLVAGSFMIMSSIKAIGHYKENTDLAKKKSDCEKVLDTTLVSWDIAFQMRLVMEWFRLSSGADPNTIEFADPTSQLKWEIFTAKYRAASGQGSSNNLPTAEYVRVWIDEKGQELRNNRAKLNSPS
ncbi:hypothetical protein G7Y89_g13919 [Cudoniella acicularis]|uniref:Uncharacterized protein n=1 Tax=Cudoniella acicularis TaxID=354080 RepID=A0A8H4VY77_9HELO|nr:hypothetical protein G7Y89_g13919 [Cudoniella acicularis]